MEIYPNLDGDVLSAYVLDVNYNTVNILNSYGETYFSQSLSAHQQTCEIGINVRKLPPGFYFVYLRDVNGTVAKKFVKE